MCTSLEEGEQKIVSLVPVKADKEGFITRLTYVLEKYCQTVTELDVADRPEMWEELLEHLSQICGGIMKAVNNEHKGIRHAAYTNIKNLLDGYKGKKYEITMMHLSSHTASRFSKSISYEPSSLRSRRPSRVHRTLLRRYLGGG